MRRRAEKNEQGIALFMAVFALLLVSAVAFGFMYMTNTETQVNSNYRSSQRAYFAARAGIEEARVRMMKGGDIYAPAVLPSLAGGVEYLINPNTGETVAPWDSTNKYADDSLCKANYTGLALSYGTQGTACDLSSATGFPAGNAWGGYYDTTGTWHAQAGISSTIGNSSSYVGSIPYKWVRITLKANRTGSPMTSAGTYPYVVDSGALANNNLMVCWDGFKQLLLPTGYTDCATPTFSTTQIYRPVYELTSMAVTSDGSKRLVSMEVANDPPIYSNAAISSQDYVTLNGKLLVDGYDHCTCTCNPDSKGVCTTAYVPVPPATSCDNSKLAIFSNTGIDTPTASQDLRSGQSPAYMTDPNNVTDITSLIDRYKSRSDTVNVTLDSNYNWTCTSGDCGTHAGAQYGTPPKPWPPSAGAVPVNWQVTYVPGTVKTGGGASGNPTQGAGVLVVDGDLEIDGNFNFYGLILVKGVVKFTGGGSSINIYGAVLAGQNSVTNVDTSLGGGVEVHYDGCSLSNDPYPQPPKLLSERELSY